MSLLIFILITDIFVLVSCTAQPDTSKTSNSDNLDPLPPWDYSEAAQVITRKDIGCSMLSPIMDEPQKTRLLIWRTKEDDRPLRVDEAVWWAEFSPDSDSKYWALVFAFRHPDSKLEHRRKWQIATICDLNYKPIQTFNQPPTSHDVLMILDKFSAFSTDNVLEHIDLYWSSEAVEDRFKVLAGGFREKTWQATIGKK